MSEDKFPKPRTHKRNISRAAGKLEELYTPPKLRETLEVRIYNLALVVIRMALPQAFQATRIGHCSQIKCLSISLQLYFEDSLFAIHPAMPCRTR